MTRWGKMKTNRIDSFSGDFAFLSNFFESPIEIEGHAYPTVEHAFQAFKTHNLVERKNIREAETPGKAKRMGRNVGLRPDWESVKIELMLAFITKKFKDPVLKQKLLETGNAELIEGNTWHDTFWGVDSNTGKGKNWLGRLLMEVREEIRQETKGV